MSISQRIIQSVPATVRDAAANIRLLLVDVDGVLTDGKLYYGNAGEELKAFNIQDGLGIKLLKTAGIEVGIITGRVSKLLERRAKELGIHPVIQGREDKLQALDELGDQYARHEIAFVGDDLPDMAVISAVGLGLCVASANAAVVDCADWQTKAPGGSGAIREVAEMLLAAQDKLDALLAAYR